MLAAPAYLGTPADIILRALACRLVRTRGGEPESVPDFLVFHDHAANFPWQSHSLWFYSQMVRWGQIGYSPELAQKARLVYRPDLYATAALASGGALPEAGAFDREAFCDGAAFERSGHRVTSSAGAS